MNTIEEAAEKTHYLLKSSRPAKEMGEKPIDRTCVEKLLNNKAFKDHLELFMLVHKIT